MLLDGAEANSVVLGQHHPTALAGYGKPLRVWRIGTEVIVVDLDRFTGTAEGVRHDVSPQRAIDEENEWSVYAASGSSHRIASTISSGVR